MFAERLSTLSDVVANAGVTDMVEGVELLAQAEDVGTIAAVIGLISEEDLERGLLARLSGECHHRQPDRAHADARRVHRARRPRCSPAGHSRRFPSAFAGTRALAQATTDTGRQLAAMGNRETAEGLARMVVAEAGAERAAEMSVAGDLLAEQGSVELAAADLAQEVAFEVASQGMADVAAGSAEMGAAVSHPQRRRAGCQRLRAASRLDG